MSCSFLIWSSLAMSANSSKKPSKLLQKREKSCWRGGTTEERKGTQEMGKERSTGRRSHWWAHLLEPLRGEKVEQMKQLL